jgi:hypothetical protein
MRLIRLVAVMLIIVPVIASPFDGKYGVKTPKNYRGPCPTTLVFMGEFALNTRATVEYHWVRSDGVEMPVERLVLEETRPHVFFATTELVWDVSPSGEKGQAYWAKLVPSDDAAGSRSGPVHVLCEGSEQTQQRYESRDSAQQSPPETVSSDAEWVIADEGPPTESDAGASEWEYSEPSPPVESDYTESDGYGGSSEQSRSATPAMTTQIITCPNEIEVGALTIPAGWTSGWNRNVLPFVTQSVNRDKLVCLYQEAPFTVGVDQPVPDNAKACHPSARGFVCTVYRN